MTGSGWVFLAVQKEARNRGLCQQTRPRWRGSSQASGGGSGAIPLICVHPPPHTHTREEGSVMAEDLS